MHIVAIWAVLGVCIGYGLSAWLVQMYRVVPPRDWLFERIAFIKAYSASPAWNIGMDVHRELGAVERTLSRPWLLVPLSAVQAGWRNVHGLEDEHLLKLPHEQVDERLQTARVLLKAIPGPESANFISRINAALKLHATVERHHERAALLREVEIFRHNYNDGTYENVAILLGKAVWLSCICLALVVALSALFGREAYFVFGAAGGLISRLTRVLQRRPKALDYGAEWSTLLLSPPAGAVLGWVGVTIAVILADAPFNVLNGKFGELWENPTAPLGLGLAFLCGFSERLFDRLLRVAGGKVASEFPAADTRVTAKNEDATGPVTG